MWVAEIFALLMAFFISSLLVNSLFMLSSTNEEMLFLVNEDWMNCLIHWWNSGSSLLLLFSMNGSRWLVISSFPFVCAACILFASENFQMSILRRKVTTSLRVGLLGKVGMILIWSL